MTDDELAEYVAFLRFALTWHGEPMRVYLHGHPFGRTRASGGLLRLSEERRHRQLEVGVAGRCTCLWARVKGADQTRRAHNFRPYPSLVVKEGSGDSRLLLWVLDEPVSCEVAKQANMRIAYRLRGYQRHGDPDALRIPATTVSWHERRRPVPIAVTRMELEEHSLGQMVSVLRVPPPRPDFARR